MIKKLLILALPNGLHAASESMDMPIQGTVVETSEAATKPEDSLLTKKLKALEEVRQRFEPQIKSINLEIARASLELEVQLETLEKEQTA